MDLDKLEAIGIEPVKELLKELGGWPVLSDSWDENSFKWDEAVYNFRKHGTYTFPRSFFCVRYDLFIQVTALTTYSTSLSRLTSRIPPTDLSISTKHLLD